MPDSIHKNLIQIRDLILLDKETEAKKLLLSLNLVDTPQHLKLPDLERHLIWDLYEYLVADNFIKLEKDEIINKFEKLI